MRLHAALAATATLVSIAFAMSTLERWLARRKPHELAWTVSLAFFALGSLALWTGAAAGWNGAIFRAFFLFGAILNVPFLALGTVYLLAPRPAAHRVFAGVAMFSAFASGIVLAAPLTTEITDPTALPAGREVFGAGPRILAASGSGLPSIVIIGGALWSAWRLVAIRRREREAGNVVAGPGTMPPGRLAAANLLIAVGTFVTGAAGLFNSMLDAMDAFAIALVIGIAVIFVGFLLTSPSERNAAGTSTDDVPLWHRTGAVAPAQVVATEVKRVDVS